MTDRLALRAILPKGSLGLAIRYAINQWDKLELYLGDGRIEIDNNLVENAIRPTKLGAKNWLFIGCKEAGQKAAILYKIVENCRRLGIDTREYLEDVLTRLPFMKAGEVATLTPANWLRARQASQSEMRPEQFARQGKPDGGSDHAYSVPTTASAPANAPNSSRAP